MSSVVQGQASGPVERRNPQERYEGTYGKIQFPQYVFQEFPKWLNSKGRSALVHTAREELEQLAAWGSADAVLGENSEAVENHPTVIEAIKTVEQNTLALAAKERENAALQAQIDELKKLLMAKAEATSPVAETAQTEAEKNAKAQGANTGGKPAK